MVFNIIYNMPKKSCWQKALKAYIHIQQAFVLLVESQETETRTLSQYCYNVDEKPGVVHIFFTQ